MNDFECPKYLTRKGKLAYQAVMSVVARHGLQYSGGCKVFYSPKQWRDRGEEYGTSSHLIVVYDGGSHREIFEPEYGFQVQEELNVELRKHGLYFEHCTGWYSAIYDI